MSEQERDTIRLHSNAVMANFMQPKANANEVAGNLFALISQALCDLNRIADALEHRPIIGDGGAPPPREWYK